MRNKAVGMLAALIVLLAVSFSSAQQITPREVRELQGALYWKAWAGIYIEEKEYVKAIEALGKYKLLAPKAHDFDQAWFGDRLAELRSILRSDVVALEAMVDNGDWSAHSTLIYYYNLLRQVSEQGTLTAQAEPSSP